MLVASAGKVEELAYGPIQMTNSICLKCGAEKFGALTQCGSCNATPRAESDLALSLVLSEHLSSRTQLAVLAHEIRSHLKLSVSEALLRQAREALKDPQLVAMLGPCPQSPSERSQTRPAPRVAAPAPRPAPSSSRALRQRSLHRSHLQQNPFALLGVTTRDDRRRIVELAEEKSLELDHDACQKARSDLTSPRTRLSAEMAWLPGMSPGKATQLVSALHSDPMSIREESGLPTLAHLNILAAAFEAVDGNDSADDVAEFIQEMACLVDDLSADQVLRDINEDRSVSGFPEVRGVDQVEAELSERKRYYRNAIKDALNRLPPASLVDAMTAAVDAITCGGENHAPELIDDLVDSYAVETQGFLQKEAENAQKLIKAARDSTKSGESAVKPIVDKLEAVARNWDKVAQPIQLSAKARGIDHEPSHEIAYSIRSLAIDLFNEHDMLAQSQRLTGLIQELFAELPEVAERVEQDASALDGIASDRNKLAAQFEEFNLTGHSFSYKGKTYDINEISHIGFYRAVTTHKTNFVETGKTERANIYLTFSNGNKADISIDEQGFFFNKDKSKQIGSVAEFYSYLSRVTFDRRAGFYESQIEKNGYFEYDDCYFYPRKKVVFRGRDFDVSSTSFLRGYGYVEMRKKDFGFLDKVKREVSLTKVPQFNTITDTDVIFYLLDKHFSLRWNS